MRTLRLLLADRLNGGVLVAFLVYGLLFQSIATGIASGRMAGSLLARTGVDCITSAPLHCEHDGSHRLDECCAAPCQIACGAGAAILSDTGGADLGSARTVFRAAAVIARADPSHPRRLGICREARAPPHFSA